ncbi:permease [Paenibacillus sp. HWE-109]|uniref:permease n=1 Tax=Paenibacillus sp. HWE-109 TaxID=1306526 RepID=UPI001EDF6EFF|nr:permease [Paenibacillus sp. HWE-109]UKS28265.1 permease [Paenibacillus sp. HWE-109]
MFAGHFGLAAAVKAKTPEVPIWALMLSTQLLDVLFVPLFLSGIEKIDNSLGTGYGKGIIHADYTHSLLGAVIIAVLSGIIAWRLWGKRGGLMIGALAFSHWLLDLLVHRMDMPILPGNAAGLPLLGFSLWQWPLISSALEVILVVAGAILYYRSIRGTALLSEGNQTLSKGARTRVILAGGVMAILLMLSLITDVVSH